jgi:hypothetical protein
VVNLPGAVWLYNQQTGDAVNSDSLVRISIRQVVSGLAPDGIWAVVAHLDGGEEIILGDGFSQDQAKGHVVAVVRRIQQGPEVTT